MKKSITLVFVIVLIPMIARAELSKSKMKKEFKLAPFMKQIKNSKVSSNHTAILYAILKNTYEVRIHQQNGAKDNQVYVHQDGHREAVFDKNGKLVQDGINDGSYNYYHPSKE